MPPLRQVKGGSPIEEDLDRPIRPYIDPEVVLIEDEAFAFVGSAYLELATCLGESLPSPADAIVTS